MEDIDLFVLHQANLRIIESVAKRLHQPMEKFPTNLEECGNISAASVPILLDNINKRGMICEGKKSSFGRIWSRADMGRDGFGMVKAAANRLAAVYIYVKGNLYCHE